MRSTLSSITLHFLHLGLETAQIKGWLRAKKIALIDSINPEWKDLAEEWFVSPQNVNGENKSA